MALALAEAGLRAAAGAGDGAAAAAERVVGAGRWGALAPAGTPPTIIDKLHRETLRVLALPEVRKRLEELGLDIIGGTPAEFAAAIKSETPHWAKVIKEAGIKLNE